MASYASQLRWAKTKELMSGLFVLVVLIVIFREFIVFVTTHLYNFLRLTWEAWVPLIVACFTHRHLRKLENKDVFITAALKVLPPVIWGLSLMLFLEVVFAIFYTVFDAAIVSKVEIFLLDLRDSIRKVDEGISHWWIVIPTLFILFYLFSDFTVIERYLKTKERLALVGVALITMTSFTFLSIRPLRVLDGWEYKENLRLYEISLRKEQKDVSDLIACRALSLEVKNLTEDKKKDYLSFLSSMRNIFPPRESQFPIFRLRREPAEIAKTDMVDDQVDKDLRQADSSLPLSNDRARIWLDDRYPSVDALRQEAAFFAPVESATFGTLASSPDMRAEQRKMLEKQKSHEKTLGKYAKQRRELLILAFSDAVGANLIKAEDLSGEYMKEVISAFSERLYDSVVKPWYESHDRFTVHNVLIAIDATIPPKFAQSIQSLRPIGIPADVEAEKEYTRRLEREAEGRIKTESDDQHREQEAMKEAERERAEERFK